MKRPMVAPQLGSQRCKRKGIHTVAEQNHTTHSHTVAAVATLRQLLGVRGVMACACARVAVTTPRLRCSVLSVSTSTDSGRTHRLMSMVGKRSGVQLGPCRLQLFQLIPQKFESGVLGCGARAVGKSRLQSTIRLAVRLDT